MESLSQNKQDKATNAVELDFALDIKALGANLTDLLNNLRDVSPIYWSEVNQAWMVTGYREVVEGYSGKLPLSNERLPFFAIAHLTDAEKALLPEVINAPKHWLLNMDGQEHRRIRKLIQRAFGQSVVESVRPDVQRYIEDTFDEIAAKAGPIEFVEEVARIIPARMILKVCDLEDTLISQMQRWSVDLNSIGNLNMPIERMLRVEKVIKELNALFRPKFEQKRRNPCDDFISALVTAVDEGDKLTEEEMLGVCQIVLIAGHDTTVNTIALGVAELARRADLVEQLRLQDKVDVDSIMEIQRRAQMSTFMSRIVSEDFDWNGHQLKKGQFVMLFQSAANHDPTIFADPQQFIFDREQGQNLAFAPGMHHCIGLRLAKMVLSEFFPAFINRFDFELLEDDLDFAATMSFRGLEKLPLKLTERTKNQAS